MSSLALALTLMPDGTGTGAGATTGTVRKTSHRNHTLCENTDGNRGEGIRGASQALHGPGAPCFPLSSRHSCRLPASGAGRA